MDVVNLARPLMWELMEMSEETVHLAYRTNTGGVYPAQERQANRVTVEAGIGARPIIHCTATRKALCHMASVRAGQVGAPVRETCEQSTISPGGSPSFFDRAEQTHPAFA